MKSYTSARSEFSGKASIFLDANENPFEPKNKPNFNRYPDSEQKLLRKKLAKHQNLKMENVICGNGSDELIDLLIRIFCQPKKDSILICPPTFGMYEVSANLNDIKVEKIDLKLEPTIQLNTKKIIKSKAKILFLPNPTAPLGTLLEKSELLKVLENFKGIIVLDETYIDFSNSKSWISKIKKYPNLVVLQTFSKYWGLAGLRIGMAFANPEIIETITKVKSPYNLNIFSQKKALKALHNTEKFETQKNILLTERKKLALFLKEKSYIKKIFPSETNFLFLEINSSVEKLYKFLINQKIVTRKFTNLGNFLRISIGTPEENNQLIKTLNQFTN